MLGAVTIEVLVRVVVLRLLDVVTLGVPPIVQKLHMVDSGSFSSSSAVLILELVGLGVGGLVSAGVGELVGELLGAEVGELVGARVGEVVGAGVGEGARPAHAAIWVVRAYGQRPSGNILSYCHKEP